MADIKQIKVGSTTYNIEPYTNYLPLAGGRMSGDLKMTENSTSILLRSESADWYSGIYANSTGDEVLGIVVANPRTHIMLGTADPTERPACTSLTPAIDIKNGKVGINKRLGTDGGADAGSYELDVNGAIRANGGISTSTISASGEVSAYTMSADQVNTNNLISSTWDIDMDGNFSTEGSLDVEGDLVVGGNVDIEYEITIPEADSLYCTAQSSTLGELLGEKADEDHVHGNINNDGTITSTAVTSATGVLVYNSSNKIQRATNANALSIIGAAKKGSNTKGQTATATANTTALATQKASGNTGNATPATGTATGGSTSVNIPTYSYSSYTLTITDNTVSVCTTSHTHTVKSHNHSLGDHTHAIDAHTHSVSSHSHEQQ